MPNISKAVLNLLILTIAPFLLCNLFVSCAPFPQDGYDLENNLIEVEERVPVAADEENATGSILQDSNRNPDREEYLDSEPQDYVVNTTPQPSPLKKSMNNLFNSLTSSVRGMLTTSQHGLLRAIGSVDKTVATVQNAIENSTYSMILEGQKAAARVYDETPQSVNRIIQRVGTVRDNRMLSQLSEVINTWRDSRKKLYEALHQREYDFHDIVQNAFATANKHLGVKELPRIQMGWY